MSSISEARAVSGKGLVGDRYFNQVGTFSDKAVAVCDLTLIESETIETLKHDFGISVEYGDFRRNIITCDVQLNDLVGQEFQIGEVALRGTSLCEPCAHIIKTNPQQLLRAMAHKCGLRARILSDGIIRAGDIIRGQQAVIAA